MDHYQYIYIMVFSQIPGKEHDEWKEAKNSKLLLQKYIASHLDPVLTLHYIQEVVSGIAKKQPYLRAFLGCVKWSYFPPRCKPPYKIVNSFRNSLHYKCGF